MGMGSDRAVGALEACAHNYAHHTFTNIVGMDDDVVRIGDLG